MNYFGLTITIQGRKSYLSDFVISPPPPPPPKKKIEKRKLWFASDFILLKYWS